MDQDDSAPPTKEFEEACQILKEDENKSRARRESFLESMKDLPPIDRAEGWLRYVVDVRHSFDVPAARTYLGGSDLGTAESLKLVTTLQNRFGEEEALTYLRSRGFECSEAIADLIDEWREDERLCTEMHASSFYPPVRFWHNHWPHIDSVMLRAVHWCEIGGFENWWKRLAQHETELVLQGGVDPTPGGYRLANMVRADYARELMPRALERMLEAIELPTDAGEPWQYFYGFPTPKKWCGRIYSEFGHASNLAFASAVLRGQSTDLAQRACEALLKAQHSQGWWPKSENEEKPSIDTTARAIHALSLNRARGWQQAAERASRWLLDAQDEEAYWFERGMPDATFLTVLVLDALSLGSESDTVTFTLPRSDGADERANTPPQGDQRTGEKSCRIHSEDFASVKWDGEEYSFSPMQAECVRILWEAWQSGAPALGQAYILEKVGSDSRRLRDLFKVHPAWGTMIVTPRKGRFQLSAAGEDATNK